MMSVEPEGKGQASCGPPLDVLLGLSSLYRGADTRAARAVKSLFPGGLPTGAPAAWFARVFDLLGTPPRDRAALRALAEGDAAGALSATRRLGLGLIGLSDHEYPAWLRHIPDPPLVLWVNGATPLPTDHAPGVAVVGSRNATPSGLAMAERLGHDLASAGLVVVSGLARGIDGAAHQGALRARGKTIGVVGCGVDVIYPRQHRDLAAGVAAAGGVLSEYPPGTPPLPRHFPLRNRIISGLSRAVVVVEASDKSGSLITAKAALEQGREVLAVPGPVASGCYRGCHGLIKDGARLVETVEDVFQELAWCRVAVPSKDDALKSSEMNDLERAMPLGTPLSVDALVEASGWSISDVLTHLGRLEVSGRVASAGAGMFVRRG